MGHAHIPVTAGQKYRNRIALALVITVTVMVAEVIGALLTGSLALLADAGHMLTDSAGLTIALIATWLAARPARGRWTFGFQRAEVFAALINGVLLAVIAVVVIIEGIRRFLDPPEVEGPLMLVFGVVGLIANLIALRLLRPGKSESLNVRGAYLEVLGDLLGSVAVIAAAVVISTTGWSAADAVASLAIGLMIAPRAALLLRDVGRVLLEGAPEDLELEQVREHMASVDGVLGVHDLHAWTITSGVPVLSAHVVVADEVLDPTEFCRVLDAVQECMHGHFDVEHSTIQLEPARHSHTETATHA